MKPHQDFSHRDRKTGANGNRFRDGMVVTMRKDKEGL